MKISQPAVARYSAAVAIVALVMLSSGLAGAFIAGTHSPPPSAVSHTSNAAASAPIRYGGPMPALQNSHVNPFASRSGEPAPMGITDYGYGSGTGAYAYNATSFVGAISYRTFYVYNASDTGYTNDSSVQLNLMLNFSYSGHYYSYWTQNVVFMSASSSGHAVRMSFIDNVWNASSGSGSFVYASSISGNGSLGTSPPGSTPYQFYYFSAVSTPGNNVTIGPGTTVLVKEISRISGSGVPEVIMQYNDGSGWITYDNIYFIFAKGVTKDYGFYVSGYRYTPLGLYYNAELVLCGPGGGSSSSLVNGGLNLSLQYWNGHNYEFTGSAYNFGGDTAETVSNVVDMSRMSAQNSSISATISAGPGTLAQMYAPSSLSTLNINFTFPSGYIIANGVRTNFTAGAVNLTLPPGAYNLTVVSTGGKKLQGGVDLLAGENLTIPGDAFAHNYRITLKETGLPPGTWWGVSAGSGSSNTSDSSSMVLYLTNGSYSLTTNATGHFSHPGSYLNFTVSGSSETVSVNFSRDYTVTFYENGLNGIEWFVTMDGHTSYNLGSSISFNLTNGSHPYSVNRVNGYYASPGNGNVTVSGNNVSIIISFLPVQYEITLSEKGLPPGLNWSVEVNGVTYHSSNSTMSFSLPNGTYSYTVGSGAGAYTQQGNNSTITVNGHTIAASISFEYSYNAGIYIFQKILFAVFLCAMVIIGAVVIRIKG